MDLSALSIQSSIVSVPQGAPDVVCIVPWRGSGERLGSALFHWAIVEVILNLASIMPQKPLPFSLPELRRKVDELDIFVKSAVLATMKDDMGPDDLGFPSTIVDELAHLHGLLDLAGCCVEEIELVQREYPELEKFFKPFLDR